MCFRKDIRCFFRSIDFFKRKLWVQQARINLRILVVEAHHENFGRSVAGRLRLCCFNPAEELQEQDRNIIIWG